MNNGDWELGHMCKNQEWRMDIGNSAICVRIETRIENGEQELGNMCEEQVSNRACHAFKIMNDTNR